jgi:hypothetical protein
MDMNIAATKTTPTATFWLMRGRTSKPSPSPRPGARHRAATTPARAAIFLACANEIHRRRRKND